MHTRIHMHAHARAHTCMQMRTRAYTHTHTHTHANTHTYIHANTHTADLREQAVQYIMYIHTGDIAGRGASLICNDLSITEFYHHDKDSSPGHSHESQIYLNHYTDVHQLLRSSLFLLYFNSY